MFLYGPGQWLPLDYPRSEAWQLLGSELLDAAAYPEEVLKAAVTLIRAQVDQDLADVEQTHYPDPAPYLLMVWVQPLAEIPTDEEEVEEEEEEEEEEE